MGADVCGFFTSSAPGIPRPQTPQPRLGWPVIGWSGQVKAREAVCAWASLGGSFVPLRLPSYPRQPKAAYTLTPVIGLGVLTGAAI
ncbi:hypothetical protein BDW68DRAFT_181830 [Aspergillus falconensis]